MVLAVSLVALEKWLIFRDTNIRLDVLRVREEEVDQRLGLLVTDQSMPVIVN